MKTHQPIGLFFSLTLLFSSIGCHLIAKVVVIPSQMLSASGFVIHLGATLIIEATENVAAKGNALLGINTEQSVAIEVPNGTPLKHAEFKVLVPEHTIINMIDLRFEKDQPAKFGQVALILEVLPTSELNLSLPELPMVERVIQLSNVPDGLTQTVFFVVPDDALRKKMPSFSNCVKALADIK